MKELRGDSGIKAAADDNELLGGPESGRCLGAIACRRYSRRVGLAADRSDGQSGATSAHLAGIARGADALRSAIAVSEALSDAAFAREAKGAGRTLRRLGARRADRDRLGRCGNAPLS